jgi:uncharacterized protein (PEP-CTERM system associated)
MAPAQLYAHARSTRRLTILLLSSIALMPWAIADAGAQTAAPASGGGGGGGAQTGSETRAMDGTTTPGPTANGGGGIALPTIKLSGLRITSSAELSETYTSNAIGVSSTAIAGYSGSDILTTATLFLGLHDHTPRVDVDFGYSLGALYYANNPSYNRLTNQLNAIANATLIPNRLLLSASAFATPILINRLGPQGAAATNSGLRDSYGYTVSPELTFRFGQFARSTTVLTQSGVFIGQPGGAVINQTVPGAFNAPGSLLSYGASQSISSGPDFYRLNWILNGAVNETTQPGLDFTVTSGTGNLQYAFSRAIIATGLFGYQSITSTQVLTETVSGPIAMLGVKLAPNRDLELSVQAGRQFNSPSYQGSLQYQIGAFTSFVGSVTDTVTSPASRLIGNLANLGVNGSGDFINTQFQVNPNTPPGSVSGVSAFNPAPLDGTAITGGIVRYRTGTLSLVHISDRTQYRMTIFHTDYKTLSQVPVGFSQDGTSSGVDLAVSRNMTPRLTGSIDGSYSKANDLGGKYDIYQGNLNLNYLLSPVMQTYFLTGYTHRNTSAALAAASPLSAGYSEYHITIGIRRQFY